MRRLLILVFVLLGAREALAQPLGPHAPDTRVEVLLLDGEALAGRLLYAEAERLYVWTAAEGFAPERTAEGVRVIPFASVASVRTPVAGPAVTTLEGTVLLGTAAAQTGLAVAWAERSLDLAPNVLGTVLAGGIVVAANRRAHAAVIDGDASRGAAFAARVRPLAAYRAGLPGALAALPVPEAVERDPALRAGAWRARRAHLSLGGVFVGGAEGPAVEGRYATGTSVERMGAVATSRSALHADGGWALSERLRVGASLVAPGLFDRPAWTMQVAGAALAPYLEATLAEGAAPRSVALTAAVGPNLYHYRTRLNREAAPALTALDPTLAAGPTYTAGRFTGVGAFGRLGAQVNVHPSAAIAVQVGYRWSPALRTEAHRVEYQMGNASGVLYEWDAFEARAQPLEVFLGTRWFF